MQYGVYGTQVAQLGPTVLQTISNPDGTVSIIQVDPTNSIITLPDGTTAQVQGVATVSCCFQLTFSLMEPRFLRRTSLSRFCVLGNGQYVTNNCLVIASALRRRNPHRPGCASIG